MTNEPVPQRIAQEVEKLPPHLQKKVLHFVEELDTNKVSSPPSKDLSDLVGSITHEDAEEMRKAIEEACEQVYPDEW